MIQYLKEKVFGQPRPATPDVKPPTPLDTFFADAGMGNVDRFRRAATREQQNVLTGTTDVSKLRSIGELDGIDVRYYQDSVYLVIQDDQLPSATVMKPATIYLSGADTTSHQQGIDKMIEVTVADDEAPPVTSTPIMFSRVQHGPIPARKYADSLAASEVGYGPVEQGLYGHVSLGKDREPHIHASLRTHDLDSGVDFVIKPTGIEVMHASRTGFDASLTQAKQEAGLNSDPTNNAYWNRHTPTPEVRQLGLAMLEENIGLEPDDMNRPYHVPRTFGAIVTAPRQSGALNKQMLVPKDMIVPHDGHTGL